MTVLSDELLASFDDSMRPVEDALTLPPVVYTSEEFLDFERRALFDHEWLCVGRASRIMRRIESDRRCGPGNSRSAPANQAENGSPHAFAWNIDGKSRMRSCCETANASTPSVASVCR